MFKGGAGVPKSHNRCSQAIKPTCTKTFFYMGLRDSGLLEVLSLISACEHAQTNFNIQVQNVKQNSRTERLLYADLGKPSSVISSSPYEKPPAHGAQIPAHQLKLKPMTKPMSAYDFLLQNHSSLDSFATCCNRLAIGPVLVSLLALNWPVLVT